MDLAIKATSPSSVRDEPLIYNSCAIEMKSASPAKPPLATRLKRNNPAGDRGDILVRGLWARDISYWWSREDKLWIESWSEWSEQIELIESIVCLLYTSDAADE